MPEIYFILVEPAVPENIGAAARALKTMGFDKLRLVNPKNFPDRKAEILAHGSQDVLENASLFQSIHEAISDIDLLIGTTSTNRTVHYDYYQCNSPLKSRT